jgi:hypothetical protein
MRSSPVLAAFVAVSMLASSAFALDPAPGWVAVAEKDFEKALAVAKEKNRPVAVLYAFRKTSCGLHNRSQRVFMAQPALEGMLRIVVYTDEVPGALRDCMRVEGASGMLPELYLLDSTGQLTGFVDYEQEYLVPDVAGVAMQIARWQSKSRDQIEKADKAAKAGRFGVALAAISKIAREDGNATAALDRALGTADPKFPQKAQTGTDAGQKESKEASSEDKEKARKKKKVDLDDEQKKEEAAKPGRYFPDLLSSKRAEYEKLAQDRIDQAKTAVEANDTAKARQLLGPFAASKSDLPQHEVAMQMLEELKSGGKAATDSEKSSTADNAGSTEAAEAE